MKMNETGVRDINRLVPDEKEIRKIKELTSAPVKPEVSEGETEVMKRFEVTLSQRLDQRREPQLIRTEAVSITKKAKKKTERVQQNNEYRTAEHSDVSFEGGLGISNIQYLNGSSIVSRGKDKVMRGKGMISEGKRKGDYSLVSAGEALVREGNHDIDKGTRIMNDAKK